MRNLSSHEQYRTVLSMGVTRSVLLNSDLVGACLSMEKAVLLRELCKLAEHRDTRLPMVLAAVRSTFLYTCQASMAQDKAGDVSPTPQLAVSSQRSC